MGLRERLGALLERAYPGRAEQEEARTRATRERVRERVRELEEARLRSRADAALGSRKAAKE